MRERIYIYKRYERFWHWSQALLIITMMLTGFEVHGSYSLLGFGKAVELHTVAAWTLLMLWAFTIHSRLSDDDRPYDFRPPQGDDYWLGGS